MISSFKTRALLTMDFGISSVEKCGSCEGSNICKWTVIEVAILKAQPKLNMHNLYKRQTSG